MKFAPHFSVANTFGAIPYELAGYEKSKAVILPVPYDGTTSYRPGARDGPRAIITASKQLELYDEELRKNFSEIGICTLDELEVVNSPELMNKRVYESAKQIIGDGKALITLGGEHSISSGAVKAQKEKHKSLSVLHIDAHADLRDVNGESKYDHACAARRMYEICPIVQVGIRSLCDEEAEFIEKEGIPVFWAEEMKDESWMDRAINKLSDTVYLSLDLDGLDPSVMPSVGTPQPGGIAWYDLLKFLRKLAEKKKVVGFDIVELAPQPGNIAPDFLAAKLTYRLIGYFFA
ncbi:agmatinase [Candidatus Woesearchaeota archaeon]|nr:agmatinase [Candidatus Woesearchaeota archaeon]